MHWRPVVLPLLLVFGGFIALVALAWRHEVGGLATSPQQLDVKQGRGVLVGGGRAVVRFLWAKEDIAGLRVRCKETLELLELEAGDSAEVEACGVTLELLAIYPGPPPESPAMAWIEARWSEEEEDPAAFSEAH